MTARSVNRRVFSRVGGYPCGVVGYWFTSAVLNAANPRGRQALSQKAKRVLRLVFSPRFPGVDLDRVRLRLGARLPAIPARPAGMALGYTIYLKQTRLDDTSLSHMALLLHELVHVAQYQRFSRLGFAQRYAESILSHLSNDYNPLEREAYDFVQSNREALIRTMRQATLAPEGEHSSFPDT